RDAAREGAAIKVVVPGPRQMFERRGKARLYESISSLQWLPCGKMHVREAWNRFQFGTSDSHAASLGARDRHAVPGVSNGVFEEASARQPAAQHFVRPLMRESPARHSA